MRSIRQILSGIALLLASGCMHVSISVSHDDPCCATTCGENGEGGDTCDPCGCKPHWWQRFNFISFHCESCCETDCSDREKTGCGDRICSFLTYRPLNKCMMDEGGPAEVARPLLYTYFEPSKYNKPLKPIECEDHRTPWFSSWPWFGGLFCRKDCCECMDGSCIAPEVAAPPPPIDDKKPAPSEPPIRQGRSATLIWGSEQTDTAQISPPITRPVREPAKTAAVSRTSAKQVEAKDVVVEPPSDQPVDTKAPVQIQTPPTPVPSAAPVAMPSEAIVESTGCVPCRPRLAIPKIGCSGDSCATGACGSGRCGNGAAACGRPKTRLDGLPILPPTMFRKYEPCDGPDGVSMLAPVPGTAVPVEQTTTSQKPAATNNKQKSEK